MDKDNYCSYLNYCIMAKLNAVCYWYPEYTQCGIYLRKDEIVKSVDCSEQEDSRLSKLLNGDK
jgi:hypothetical protein